MVVVEFAYSQTEPMLHAKRGDILDFKVAPIDQCLPEFTPAKVKPPQFALATGIREKMAAMQAKAGKLRQQAIERQRFRETADYRTALQMLAVESHSADPVPALRGHMSRDVLEDLGASPA
jgi:hypothetical protein